MHKVKKQNAKNSGSVCDVSGVPNTKTFMM